MSDQTKKSFGWGYLILGILLIITSLIAFNNPFSDILALTMVFGFMAIISGVWLIVNRERGNSVFRIVVGILNIIVGVILIFNLGAGALAMPYVFAIWFIMSSVYQLCMLGAVKKMYGNGFFWFSLVLNILCVIAGIILIFHPLASVLTMSFVIGFYFMMAGIESIIYAFHR